MYSGTRLSAFESKLCHLPVGDPGQVILPFFSSVSSSVKWRDDSSANFKE